MGIEADIDESLAHEERAVRALEEIAEALTLWVKLQQAIFEREYPEKRGPRDATVTHIPSEEERLRANLQGPEKTINEWLGPGPFERKFEKSKKSESSKDRRSSEAAKGDSAAD